MKSSILPIFALLLTLSCGIANSNQKENKPEVLATTVNSHALFGIEEKTLAESQRCFDRSLSILNTTVTAIGHLISLFALIVVIGAGFGITEINNWKRIRKAVEKASEEIKESCAQVHTLADDALIDKGRALCKLEKYGAALQALGSVGEINTEALGLKGFAQYKLDNYSEAILSFNDCIRINKDLPLPWFYRACIHASKKDKAAALDDLTNAIRLAKADGKNEEVAKLASEDINLRSYLDDSDFKKVIDRKG